MLKVIASLLCYPVRYSFGYFEGGKMVEHEGVADRLAMTLVASVRKELVITEMRDKTAPIVTCFLTRSVP